MYIACMIVVTLINGYGQRVDETRTLYGKLIRQTESGLIGDFSLYAKNKEYIGDYSQVLVPKSLCRIDN